MTDRKVALSDIEIRALLKNNKTSLRHPLTRFRSLAVPDQPYGCLYKGQDAARVLMEAADFRRVADDIWTWSARAYDWQQPATRAHWGARIFYAPGDRICVREGYAIVPAGTANPEAVVEQRANPQDCYDAAVYRTDWERSKPGRWMPASTMPRWASRMTLIISDVRIERLQDISEADAIAEGCFKDTATDRIFATSESMRRSGSEWASARDWYADFWETIYGPRAWDANPWVIALSFEVAHRNIDEVAP